MNIQKRKYIEFQKFVRLVVLTSIFFLPISCKKKTIEFTIEGTITDISFNSPQKNGILKLYKIAAGGGGEDFVANASPSSNGAYTFTFERDKSEKYIIRYKQDGYFEEEKTVFFSALNTNEPYILNFETEATATINWIVTNVAPNSPNDKVVIQKLNGREDCPTCCLVDAYEYTGANINETLTCTVNGNRYVRFYIVNLAEQVVLDSVYCPAFGSVNYSVNF